MKLQKTIKNQAKLSGKGLFEGKEAKVSFCAAPVNSGIVFVRTDVADSSPVAATAANIAPRNRRTTVQNGSLCIETVEHCLAVINALEIDNLTIEIDGPELPAPDCSSLEYFKALKQAVPIEQPAARLEFVIQKPIAISDKEASIYALPSTENGLSITYDLDYGGHTGVGRQVFSCRVTPESFEKHLAAARTFLLEPEARQFQARGVGTHLGPKDILVIDSDGPVKNSFRFADECARHKIVDLIGDLALVGRAVKGRILAYKSGHNLNRQLVARLVQAARQQERMQKSGSDAILDVRQIARILPHRYPFLLVDKVVEIEGDKRITGIKNVSINEHFFQGHFPGTPIMPGVLVVEAMAQLSGLLFAQRLEHAGKLAVLLSMDGVKLRRAIVPGDQLVLTAEVVRLRKRTAQCHCKATVGEQVAAEADIRFMLVDDEMYNK